MTDNRHVQIHAPSIGATTIDEALMRRVTLPTPYIGVSGVTTIDEALMLAELVSSDPLLHGRVAAGLLVSQKTVQGGDVNSRSVTRDNAPKVARILAINGIAPVVHYFTKDQTGLTEQILAAWAFVGCESVHFQLNLPFPITPLVCEQMRFAHAKITAVAGYHAEVIAQINPTQLEAVTESLYDVSYEHAMRRLAATVFGVNGFDRGLVDLSAGNGIGFGAESQLALRYLVRAGVPAHKLGAAGAFGPIFTERQAAVHRSGTVSIDAESKLRSSAYAAKDACAASADGLVRGAVAAYLRQATRLRGPVQE